MLCSSGHRGMASHACPLARVCARSSVYMPCLASAPPAYIWTSRKLGTPASFIYTCPIAHIMSCCAITLLRRCAVTQYTFVQSHPHQLTHNTHEKQSMHAIERPCTRSSCLSLSLTNSHPLSTDLQSSAKVLY